MRRASVIGLGNIACGDLGAGCYVIDALLQEPLGEAVDLWYLAEAGFYAGAHICGSEFAVIVQAVCMGGPPGKICCWDKGTFDRNLCWAADRVWSMMPLADGFARAALSETFPGELLFVWIEPQILEGFAVSPEMVRALRKTVGIVKDHLFQRGFLTEDVLRLSLIHHLQVPGITI